MTTKFNYTEKVQQKLSSVQKSKMTVKEFLEFQTQAMIEVIEEGAKALNADLDQDWRSAEMELQKMRQEAANFERMRKEEENDEDLSTMSAVSEEDKDTTASSKKGTAQKRTGSRSALSTLIVKVQVMSGPHIGQEFQLKPKARSYCWVGRSTGQKFTKNGISLCEDQEVSTAHGKILVKAGKLYYSDHGSTNGSFLVTNNDEVELMPEFMQELEDGMVIRIGLSNLKIML